MEGTNLMFAWIALDASAGSIRSVQLYFWAVLLEDLFGAFATIAFTTFITHSATQYAATAALGTLGRTTLAAFLVALH